MANVPEIKEDYKLEIEIENSIQDDLISSVKPDLLTFLRKELSNSKIQLVTKLSEKSKDKIIYSDTDKYEEMVKKNPALSLLRQKFNLDFGQ